MTTPSICASAPISFAFEQKFDVRVVMVDGEPWFVAKDVAIALGYSNTKQAVIDHCKRAKSLKALGVANRDPKENQSLDPQTKLIPEPDVYRLITRSQLPGAERFENWIFEEVLPSIRKTGGYQMPKADVPVTLETLNSAGLHQLAQIVYLIRVHFHMEGQASHAAYAHLRKRFGLEHSVSDLPAIYFDQAVQILTELERLSFQFKGIVIQAEREFFRQVLRSGKALDEDEFNALFDAELQQMMERHNDALKLLN
jgi:prophage antirepressor-like protein